jgi:hypothetical protein
VIVTDFGDRPRWCDGWRRPARPRCRRPSGIPLVRFPGRMGIAAERCDEGGAVCDRVVDWSAWEAEWNGEERTT